MFVLSLIGYNCGITCGKYMNYGKQDTIFICSLITSDKRCGSCASDFAKDDSKSRAVMPSASDSTEYE